MSGRLLSLLSLLLSLLPQTGSAPATEAVSGTVCLDPGHSRATVGTAGRKIAEYQICWQMAVRLRAELEKRGVRVVLTKRNADENVSNEGRAATANREEADLFLRLHCDADTGRGIATFYPDRQGKKNGVRGPSREVIAESRRCARRFHTALIASLDGALADRGIRADQKTAVGRRQGGALTGSIYSQVPVLLIEMCVLTNPKDEAFILSEEGQKRLTRALADGTAAVLRARQGGTNTERASD